MLGLEIVLRDHVIQLHHAMEGQRKNPGLLICLASWLFVYMSYILYLTGHWRQR